MKTPCVKYTVHSFICSSREINDWSFIWHVFAFNIRALSHSTSCHTFIKNTAIESVFCQSWHLLFIQFMQFSVNVSMPKHTIRHFKMRTVRKILILSEIRKIARTTRFTECGQKLQKKQLNCNINNAFQASITTFYMYVTVTFE